MSGGCGAEGPEGIRCNRQHTVGGMHQAFDGKRTVAWETLPFAPLHDDHAPSAATTNMHNSVGRSDAFETTAVEVLAEIAFQLKRVADAMDAQAEKAAVRIDLLRRSVEIQELHREADVALAEAARRLEVADASAVPTGRRSNP